MNIIEFDIPNKIQEILSILTTNNVSYYLFGGSVRDVFTQKKPNDYDFVVTGIDRNELCKILDKNNIPNYLVSARKQVQGLCINGIYCEFACCKGKADLMKYIKELDFTCNQIILDVENGSVVDIFNGCNDIRQKKVRTILPPEECFELYPFNMVRASYVAMNTGFYIDEVCVDAMRNCKKSAFEAQYRLMSTTIIDNILSNYRCEEGLKWLAKTGILEKEFPKLYQKVINNKLNYDEIRYINENIPELAYDDVGLDYKTALLFMDVFSDDPENITKFRFYDTNHKCTAKLLKYGVQYYNLLGTLSIDEIDQQMREKRIKPENRAEILNLIAELRDIKEGFKKEKDSVPFFR